MKYIIRLLAGLPVIATGVTSILLFALSFDYHFLIVLTVFNVIAFVLLLDKYEETVKEVYNLFKLLRS